MKKLFKNWKTTLAGIAVIALKVFAAKRPDIVTPEIGDLAAGVILGGGLLAAKDYNKTGN